MNELTVSINGKELPIKEYNGKRVVTLKEIDAVHNRNDGTARKRFNDNKGHFIEGEDYFKVKCSEVRPFFGQTLPNGFNPNADITLLTESGYRQGNGCKVRHLLKGGYVNDIKRNRSVR